MKVFIDSYIEEPFYKYLQILDFSVDVPCSQAGPTERLQQAQYVAWSLHHGVGAKVLYQSHQIVELLSAAHVVLVVL